MIKKIPPHILFFIMMVISYVLPTLFTLFFDINDHLPYVIDQLSEFKNTRWGLLIIYIIIICSFIIGSSLVTSALRRFPNIFVNIGLLNKFHTAFLSKAQKYFIYGFIILGVFCVYKMWHEGLFSVGDYMESFDIANTERNLFAMLCDICIFLFVFLFFNSYKLYKPIRYILILLIGVTLLAGSRMYIIPLIFFYLYINIYVTPFSRKQLYKLGLFSILVFAGLIFIFTLRHNSSIDSSDTIMLLLQYESIGVHIPLMKEINMEWHTQLKPDFIFLFSDTFLFLIPRIVFPLKNDYLFFDNQIIAHTLSPYGGINGIASVIIYFGVLFPIPFFILGALLSYIHNQCKRHYNNSGLNAYYVYLCCSFIFSFMRNGILIGLKNAILIALIATLIMKFKFITIRRL